MCEEIAYFIQTTTPRTNAVCAEHNYAKTIIPLFRNIGNNACNGYMLSGNGTKHTC